MRRSSLLVVAAAIALVTMSGCSEGGRRSVSVDGHVFSVPEAHLVRGTIPWLPVSQSDGLTFVTNPEAPLAERVSVLVQSTSVTCRAQAAPAYDQLASACKAAAQGVEDQATESRFEVEKVYENKDDPWWTYRLQNPSGNGLGAMVASCSAMSDGDGLCHSLGHYHDLVYSVGLRDSEIKRLPAIHAQVRALLSSWEQPRR